MRTRRAKSHAAVAASGALLVAASTLSGCGTKASSQTPSGTAAVPGVTGSTITVASLAGITGPFAAVNKQQTEAQQLTWKMLNAAGGVCGRQVNLKVVDTSYDVQKTVTAYAQVRDKVAALAQVAGSPMAAALLPSVEADSMLTIPTAFSSNLLESKQMMMLGAPYDLLADSAVDFFFGNGRLAAGDTVGVVYLEGDYGDDNLKGVRAAADRLGLQVKGVQITATASDMTAPVTTLQRSGAKLIVLATTTRQAATIASVASTSGLDVPLVTASPAFSPALLDTPAAAALDANMYDVTSWQVPAYIKDKEARQVVAKYGKDHPGDELGDSISIGIAQSLALYDVLKKACENEGLSHRGLVDAFRSMTDIETGGIFPALNYTRVGSPSTRGAYIWKVDSSVDGGLKMASNGIYRVKK